jgi:hypothetical protein
MSWLSALLSSAPGSPAMHNVILLLGTVGFLALAMYHISTLDPWTYVGCIGALATSSGGAALMTAGADRISSAKSPSATPPT